MNTSPPKATMNRLPAWSSPKLVMLVRLPASGAKAALRRVKLLLGAVAPGTRLAARTDQILPLMKSAKI
ncbi:hypothetical protein D3C83_311790 [compost metagenome]